MPASDPFLEDARLQARKIRQLADQAIDQLDERDFFSALGDGGNSVAILVKHMAGNMRSRWTDFLTTDGEKPDRQRDREFVVEDADSRDRLLERWDAGWRCFFDTLAALVAEDLGRTVTLRGEPHTALQAIHRQLTHYAYHAGQIVLLARHLRGERWRWLSIPPGKSEEFDVSKDGNRYFVSPPETE